MPIARFWSTACRISLLAVTATALLFGCSTFPEPTGPQDTLVVATYRFDGDASVSDVLGPGFGMSNVQVTLRSIDTDKSVRLVRRGGVLSLSSVPPGRYQVDGLTLGIAYRGDELGDMDLRMQYPFYFEIKVGVVSNLGAFLFTVNEEEETLAGSWVPEYELAYERFVANHPESPWHEFEWNVLEPKDL